MHNLNYDIIWHILSVLMPERITLRGKFCYELVLWLKQQAAWLRARWPGFDPGCWRGGEFSSLLHDQTGPEVHSASYKMSTGGFPWGVKAVRRRTSHPTSSKCEYVDPCIHIPHRPSRPVMGYLYLSWIADAQSMSI